MDYIDYKKGTFGATNYGGQYVPPVLKENLERVAAAFEQYRDDPEFMKELTRYLQDYVGRPSPLYYARRLSKEVGSKIYLKREDLNHTGSHKINNTIGQVLLAKRMNATEIIAETGAGQHGVAVATAASLMGLKSKIFMGAEDARRQKMNLQRIKMLGAEVVITKQGTGTLKDAIDVALDYFVSNPESYYLLGSAVGPHPYPLMVRHFQSVIGYEAREQILKQEGRLPDHLIACIGGGSNAIGFFSAFLKDKDIKISAAEGGGFGINSERTAATICVGKPAVFQGTYSYCMLDDQDRPRDAYSVSAGLAYPGIGPEHSWLNDTNRVDYYGVPDDDAIEAFSLLSRLEGIIPAIESAHAIALALKILKDKNVLAMINLSGRGDKDMGRF